MQLSLVSRDRELSLLRAALAATRAGRGDLVLIGGEAGIGKTTLAEALLAEATAQGALALVGRCYDRSETPPYGPWAEALEPCPAPLSLAERPAAGSAPASQVALFARVRDSLAALAATRPLVLLLEDLHWADPASLDLLRSLGREAGGLPLLLLATYRADELTRRHPLYALLPLLVRESRATRLDLRPLEEADLRALAAGLYALPPADEARLVTYLHARTEGNPFYAGEVLRTLEEEGVLRRDGAGWALGDPAAAGVPALLSQVIEARVAHLGEATRDLLALAATIGQEVPLAPWATLATITEETLLEAVERAVEARILVALPGGTAVRFAHALIRETLYAGVLAPRRRTWHRQIGEVLAAVSTPDPDMVAHHFRQAGDPRAAEWLLRAGARAQRAHAWLTAADRFAAALALLDRDTEAVGERGWLRLRLALLRRYRAPDEGIALLTEAEALAQQEGDAALAACALFYRGLLGAWAGAMHVGIAAMEAGVAALDRLAPTDRERLRVRYADGIATGTYHPQGILAAWLAIAGRAAEAVSLAEPIAAGRGHSSGTSPDAPLTPLARADAYGALGAAYALLGRPEEARRELARSQEVYLATGHAHVLGLQRVTELTYVALPYRADHPRERERLARAAEDALVLARETQAPTEPTLARLEAGLIEGAWPEVRPLAAAMRAGPSMPRERIVAARVLGLLARGQGEPELAWGCVREWLPAGPATPPGDTEFIDAQGLQRLAVNLALDAGDLPLAREWLAANDRWLAWSGAVLGQAEGRLGWAAYHRAAGDIAATRQHAEQALAHASVPRQPLALLATHRLFGALDTADGRYADAQAHLDAALALADACAAPYERALTLLALGELHLAAGDMDQARGVCTEARAICAPLGARPALARARASIARLATATAAPPPHQAGLTAREVEVLRLVAQGLSNVVIADRLFLSRRTVEQHLRSIYDKFGVDNRTAAARAAAERGLA